MHVDTALQLWSDGQRRLRRAEPDERRLLERVATASSTSCAAASAARSRRASWPTSTARDRLVPRRRDRDRPDDPRAWDAQTAGDAAFARYVREASDWSGGRRRDPDEIERQQQPLDQP